MAPPRRAQPRDERTQDVRQKTPLQSVSTRIVFCVFASTLLTALTVSWLAVGAIQRDVQRRIGQRTERLLHDRSAELDHWHSQAAGQLAAASAIGSRWHAALLQTLAEHGDASRFDWRAAAAGAAPPKETLPTLPLPAPPEALGRHVDRLRLSRDRAGESELDCLSVRVDLVRRDSTVAGRLDGCLAEDLLYEVLLPAGDDGRDLRLAVADRHGVLIAAAGIRAESRIGQRVPLASLLANGQATLARYDDDKRNTLVASATPLARPGWSLVVETERARAFEPSIAITKQIFIVDVCIILLFSVLAYKITRAIMQPIEALSAGAQRIAAGDMHHEIPMPDRQDELSLLTESFNGMMMKLRRSQQELEKDRFRLAEQNEELQRANEILAQLSITDGLTKLHNHRYFQDHLTREIKRVSRTKSPLSMILIDIDDFKLLNDTHGHAAGDEVLVSLAAIMNDSARESDLIARYGGEEFVILMPNTDLAGAVHLAEKLRMAAESTRLIIGDTMRPIEVTISLGVALYKGNRREFFAEADRALYQAKAAGKNCVIIAGSDQPEAT